MKNITFSDDVNKKLIMFLKVGFHSNLYIWHTESLILCIYRYRLRDLYFKKLNNEFY